MTLHPLEENSKWIFDQPTIRFDAVYTIKGLDEGDASVKVRSFGFSSSCREALITNLRQHLRASLCDKNTQGWRTEYEAKRGIEFGTEASCGPGLNKLTLVQAGEKWNQSQAEELAQVCDYLMGPICVLLDPLRPKGDWWSQGPAPFKKIGGSANHTVWSGTTNWFLTHPATMAIITGLYRQCFQLVRAGEAEKIFAAVEAEHVEDVLTNCSQLQALKIVNKLRPWIEVPLGKPSAWTPARRHYAFPMGTWARLIKLQRAIRRHSYEGAMNKSFMEGWNLLPGDVDRPTLSGVTATWGDEEELTPEHEHLMKAGAPRRRKVVRK